MVKYYLLFTTMSSMVMKSSCNHEYEPQTLRIVNNSKLFFARLVTYIYKVIFIKSCANIILIMYIWYVTV